MIRLKTISSIELTNICNLKCDYCINRLMPKHGRKYEVMKDFIFDATLEWLQRLCDQGTQQEVSLQGNGESCLDPQLISRIKRVKQIMGPSRMVFMCSNGEHIAKDPDMVKRMKDAGLDRLDLSMHRPEWVRMSLDAIKDAQMPCIVNPGAAVSPHNWAGQLESEFCVKHINQISCDPLMQGRGYVQSYGGVSPCCYDFRGFGHFGSVLDANLLDKPIKPYDLCNTCHQVIPEYILEETGEEE